MNRFGPLPVLGALFMVSFAGCHCQDKVDFKGQCKDVSGNQADHPDPCDVTLATDCAEHFTCSPASKDNQKLTCCVFADRKCNTEADCCPGQTCPVERKKCFDKFLSCETDADCGDKGDSFCEAYSDIYGNSNRCRFKPCGDLGQCPDGQACFQGECMAGLPCDGFCEPGKACVPSINRCQDYSMPGAPREAAACPMTCAPGFIATFNDNRNLWDSCDLPKAACKCAELPGLTSEDLGRYSAITLEPTKALWVSSYDGQYGDLTVFQYDLAGKRVKQTYIDGVPSGQTVKYGPSGARGGVVEPGDDVGRYTDIVSGSNGLLYVSYYDVTNGNLRFAYRTPDDRWTTLRVDGETADLGLFTSVAVDQDGLPGISYFQKGADSAFNTTDCPPPVPTGAKTFISALKFAKATSATPGPGDWQIKTIACQSRPAPACYQCNDVCADPGTGAACLKPSTGCVAQADGGGTCDANTETCVLVGTTPTCAKKYNPSTLNDLPEGVGLFSSLAFNGKDAFIAFMKRQTPSGAKAPDGDLYGVQVSAAGTVGALVALDTSGDTGFFPDVKVDPASKRVAVSYHDFSSKALKYYSALGFQTGVTPEIIDTGAGAAGAGEADWVGTDSALVFGGGGLYAVYQDPTRGDLKLAKRGQTWQVLPSIATEGAVGFFADAVFNDGKIFASHAKIHAKLISGEPHVDNSLLVESVAAP